MSENKTVELSKVIQFQKAYAKYKDDLYFNLIKQFNSECQDILKDDLGSQFVKSCGRDLAGEIVRNFFDTSDFHVTVDQLAERIIRFEYKNEYDPLNDNSQVRKNVYNYSEITSSRLDDITKDMDENKEKLFMKVEGKNGKPRYENQTMINEGKDAYHQEVINEDGTTNDEMTGDIGMRNQKGADTKGLPRHEVDHVQSLASATYNGRYIKASGIENLQEFYNSRDNFQIILGKANNTKGDAKVFDKDGNDITHRATPEQLADAIASKLEGANAKRKQELKDNGYLNEDGTVPKHIKKELISKIKHSQNAESKVILKNTKYGVVATDAAKHATASAWKILAGQVIYYTAPPLIYEARLIIQNKPSSIDNALDELGKAAKRIGKYVLSKLKDMLGVTLFNSFKNFIKIFMDILINLVKATVKKLLKIIKSLVLSVVDSVKILAQKDTSTAQKADAVCNLFGVTITTIAVDTLFEAIKGGLPIPDFLFMPLQILTTVVCTNFTMLILQKADLFDVRFGFKINAIKDLFEKTQNELDGKLSIAKDYTANQIEEMIQQAKNDVLEIYHHLMESDIYEVDIREDLNRINKMFNMEIDFENDFNKFAGTHLPSPV